MRKPMLIAASLMVLAGTMSAPNAMAQSEMVDGVVTKIDAASAKITIRHGPLKKFDMDEGHTMVFRVADPAMLKAVKAGDKVKFEPDRVNGQFTVMKIEKKR